MIDSLLKKCITILIIKILPLITPLALAIKDCNFGKLLLNCAA